MRNQTTAFSGLVAHSRRGALLELEDQTQLVLCTVVSDNYFSVLGVKTAIGRAFHPDLDNNIGAEPAVVISYSLWQRRFESDPELVGRTIRLNEGDYTVVGIMSPSFRGLIRYLSNDVWVPTSTWAAMTGSRSEIEDRGLRNYDIRGRLQSGVTIEQAQVQLDTIARRLRETYPDTNQETHFVVTSGDEKDRGRRVGMSLLLMTIVGLVFLIACVNVANILLVTAEARGARYRSAWFSAPGVYVC